MFLTFEIIFVLIFNELRIKKTRIKYNKVTLFKLNETSYINKF